MSEQRGSKKDVIEEIDENMRDVIAADLIRRPPFNGN